MKKVWIEYALVPVVILFVSIGYLVYTEYKEDILAYSLDRIGTQLVDLVDGEQEKSAIARLYEGFKTRVLGQEVSPDQVETMVANVLNLSNSGARLTSEEAELMLRYAMEPQEVLSPASSDEVEEAMPAPSARSASPVPSAAGGPVRTAPPAPEMMAQLGERLKGVLDFHQQMHVAQEEHRVISENLRYRVGDGLHVYINPDLEGRLPMPEFKRLAREAKKLEQLKVVVWKKDLDEDLRAERNRAEKEMRAMIQGEGVQDVEGASGGAVVEVLKSLEMMGHLSGAEADSVRIMMRREVQQALEEVRVQFEQQQEMRRQ